MTATPEAISVESFDMQPDRGVVKILLSFLRPYRCTTVLLVTLGFVASVSEGIGIGLFIPFLETLDSGRAVVAEGNWLGDRLDSAFRLVPEEYRLLAISIAIFGSIFLKALLTYASGLFFNSLSARVGHKLRAQIFDEVLNADFRTLHAIGTGRILNALHTESWKTTDAIAVLLHAIITLSTLIVYLALLLLISWKLTLVVVSVMLLISMAVRLLTRKVGRLGRNVTDANAELARRMVDGVDGIEVIRAYGQESYERRRFDVVSTGLAHSLVRLGISSGAVYPVYEVLAAAILVTVLMSSLQISASLAPVLVFVFLLYRLEPKIKAIDRARVDLRSLEGAVVETFSIIDKRNKQYVLSGNKVAETLRDRVIFDRVSFRYAPESPLAVKDLCLEIPANKMTAVVGPSGAGKSTLAKLLLRFFDPTDGGSILIDGTPLPDLDLESWRNRISVVTQEVFLFNATVRENIAYGRVDATDDEIVGAAQAAGAHDFILSLPGGYGTPLGHDGVRLSGGERQRICLARALLRQPDILILDEATNALDSISEELVQKTLESVGRNCTTIVIAHRLATIEQADQILVLKDGRLVERGDLDHLLRLGGLFTELYEMQNIERAAQVKAV